VLLISHILEQVFAKTLTLTIKYAPGNQALKENKSLNSLKLVKNHPISLHTLLTTAIINRSPNSLLMLANQVVGSNKNALNIIKNIAAFNGIQEEAALNITGRRITNKVQRLDLYDTFLAANTLFNFPPFILDYLS